MTDAELDALIAEAVACHPHPPAVVYQIACEVLKLRAEVARLKAELHGGAT